MHYWNKANFEGLRELGESTASDPRLEGFSQYCLLREQGLRQQALEGIQRFLTEARSWDQSEQRRFADWVCQVHASRTQIHQLLPAPLKDWVTEVLRSWSADEEAATPMRWLGTLTRDMQAFEEALRRDPTDDYSRRRLILDHADDLDYAGHHFPDYFVGEPSEVLSRTAAAEPLIAGFADPSKHLDVIEEYRTNRQRILDWVDHQAADSPVSFGEWCRKHRGYVWRGDKAYYYKQKSKVSNQDVPDHREHYIIAIHDRGKDQFFVWYEDEDDGLLVDENSQLAGFDDASAAASETAKRGFLLVSQEVTAYNFGTLRAWASSPSAASIEPEHFLNAWNLLVDVARSVGNAVALEALWGGNSRGIYDKLFRACNLPAMTEPGDGYVAEWSVEETERLAELLRVGLHCLDHARE